MTTPAEYEAQIAELTNELASLESILKEWKAVAKEQQSRILELEARVAGLSVALRSARGQFHHYRNWFKAVGRPDGENTNRVMAEMCDAALSLPSSPGLLDRVVKVLEKVEQDHQFPFTVNHDELLAEVQSLLSELPKGA